MISFNNKKNSKYLIIDELGKLELKNEGLNEAAKNLIHTYISDVDYHLILVIRNALIPEILKHYKILKYQLLEKDDLMTLE